MLPTLYPYRIAHTAEPRPLDETDAYEARLRSQVVGRAFRRAFAGLVAIAGFVLLLDARAHLRSSHHEHATRPTRIGNAREVIAAARAFAVTEQARFARAITTARADEERGVSPPSCTETVTTAGAPFVLVTDDDAPTSPSLAQVLAEAAQAEAAFGARRWSEGIARTDAMATRLASEATRPRYDIAVVTRAARRPTIMNATTYEPGEVDGRAYVYDFDAHRVRCASDLYATSSARIAYPLAERSAGLLSALAADFQKQTERALALVVESDKTKRREPPADTEER